MARGKRRPTPGFVPISSPREIVGILREALKRMEGPHEIVCVVPSAAVAHQVRVDGEGLPGVRFETPATLAESVLLAAGEPARRGAQKYRAFAVEAVLASGELDATLSYFNASQLRAGAGYAEAIAATLGEMERSLAGPDALRRASDEARRGSPEARRLSDLAAIAESVQRNLDATPERTTPSLLARAARRLADGPGAYPYPGATYACFDAWTDASTLSFLATVPRLTLLFQPALPSRDASHRRLEEAARILGIPAGDLAPPAASAHDGMREIDRLQARLFRPPTTGGVPVTSVGADGAAADGTVSMEEYAGVQEELQAAIDWVADLVLARGTPLQRIAILAPRADPYAAMLADRLSSLPWADPADPPVHVAGGVPTTTRAAGARLLALAMALEASLPAVDLARLLPAVRPSDDRGHLSHAEAVEAAHACGVAGGSAGRPEDARAWPDAATRRLRDLGDALARNTDPDDARSARKRGDLKRLMRSLEATADALRALVDAHETVLSNAPLADVWKAFECVASRHLHLPPGPSRPSGAGTVDALDALREQMRRLLDTPFAGRVRGRAALRTIRRAIEDCRDPVGRFGEPRVYVGTVASAAGLSFDAVRIVGAHEGALPARVGVDPILPDAERAALDGTGRIVARRGEEPLRDFHDLHRVVRGVRESLVVSFPRQSADGTVTEPSGLLLEIASAVGRGGIRVPTLADLPRLWFAPARGAATARPASPTESARALRLAARPDPARARVPPAWLSAGEGPLDLARMRALVLDAAADAGRPCDGILPEGAPLPRRPGVTPQDPTSASRLKTLLECPYRFLLEQVLDWRERALPPSDRRIESLAFGSLLHSVMEEFLRGHGADFAARRGALRAWLDAAREIAGRAFARFLGEYPLPEEPVRRAERDRLLAAVDRLLETEWHGPARDFVAVEQPFGIDAQVRVATRGPQGAEGTPLFLRGYIDRVDREEGRLVLRDYKSGTAHPRGPGEPPDPVVDVQLAAYALALGADGAAYVYADPRYDPERAFRGDDFQALRERGREWMGIAAALLETGRFPRTTRPEDCRYCPFVPVCGDGAPGRAAGKLAREAGPVEAFLALKHPSGGKEKAAPGAQDEGENDDG